MEKRIILRLFICVWVASVVVGLSSVKVPVKKVTPKPTEESSIKINTEDIDQQVDTILTQFGVNLKQVRKKKISIPMYSFTRFERQVTIPNDTPLILITSAFHSLCLRYQGRAIASENTKESTLTIHLEIEHNIIQSLVIRRMVEKKSNILKKRHVR